MQKILLLMSLIPIFAIAGCQEKHSQLYLMTHPKELKTILEACQSSNNRMESAQCQMAEKAADAFNDLLMEQQSNPERFGERIMEQEIACINLKAEPNPDHTKIAITCNQIKVMLAVVGINSPE